jgi:hypothetical protein
MPARLESPGGMVDRYGLAAAARAHARVGADGVGRDMAAAVAARLIDAALIECSVN